MKSGRVSLSGRTQLWLAAGFILLAATIGIVTLMDVWRSRPERSLPPTTLNVGPAGQTAKAITAQVAAPTPTPSPTLTPTLAPAPTPTPRPITVRPNTVTPAIVRAKIEIVWPHDGAIVRDADQANITAYLIAGSGIGGGATLDAPPCAWTPTVRLWRALNNQPAAAVAVGEKRMLTTAGRTYPVWDFNDVDVSEGRDPANKLAFFVSVDGVTTLPNIWAHAADARTIFPQTDVPLAVLDQPPAAVDARIQIVWPHNNLPITEATRANVTAYLFAAGTLDVLAVETDWRPTVQLHWSVNSEPERVGSTVIGKPRTTATGTGMQFLAWDFNDVDISAARDPLNRMYFWVTVDDVITYSSVWAHGADARTIFPQVDVLNSCR